MRVLSWMPAKRLVLSYVLDWISILAIAGIGGAFATHSPYKRPFSLVDLSIQFPYEKHEVIPTWLLVVLSVIAPGAIIFLVCLLLVPGRAISKQTPRSLIWRRKLWEWNTGWMGLGLSLAIAFLFTQGMKNLFGKPRPDLLDRCQPDLSAASIARHTIGGYAAAFNRELVLVNAEICQQTDSSILDDGFRSFPSGHASTSWSGLFYLALFLCSKFSVVIPFLPPKRLAADLPTTLDAYEGSADDSSSLPTHKREATDSLQQDSTHLSGQTTLGRAKIPPRNQAAAPPVYLLALPLVPISVAIYITASRFFQFFHHGFDILSGASIGVLSAWFAFRWYHLPLGQGAGWSWGARSRDRALAIGVGVPGYVGTEGWASRRLVNSGKPVHPVLGPGYDGSMEGEGDVVRQEQPRGDAAV